MRKKFCYGDSESVSPPKGQFREIARQNPHGRREFAPEQYTAPIPPSLYPFKPWRQLKKLPAKTPVGPKLFFALADLSCCGFVGAIYRKIGHGNGVVHANQKTALRVGLHFTCLWPPHKSGA